MKLSNCILSLVALASLAAGIDARACTSAIVGRGRSASGAALLWKHRDTGAPHNFIAHHEATDSTLEYIALHNCNDTQGREAWIGMNRAGFAVMNTASYNLVPDTATVKDREGLVMTAALQKCRTINDFKLLLDSLPRPMGVQANFGVIDSSGNAAYFETHDHGYKIYGVADSAAIVRTNYSHSGGPEGRLGVTREGIADLYLRCTPSITREDMLDNLSRRLFDPDSGFDITQTDAQEAVDNGDFIPRYISTASIAIEAVPSAAGDGTEYVMWTMLGYPPCADVYKVTFDSIPAQVKPGSDGITDAERKADRKKSQVYDGRKKGKHRIINISKLRELTD
ncbi:MAG: C45 family peptidase [Muribaculaceae bacterium]|nr:C45 family peptidase [Muribaculaceae bacterium]